MKFLTKLAVLAFASAACFANAGHFTVNSVTTTSYVAPVSPAGHLATSTKTVGSKSFSLELDLRPAPGGTGTITGGCLTSHNVWVEVEWHPDAGDPNPGTWDAYWNVEQSRIASLGGNWIQPTSPTVIDIAAIFAPDPGLMSFNIPFHAAPLTPSPLPGSVTTNNSLQGGFSFSFVGGKWIGQGGFAIGLQEGHSGTISAFESGGVICNLKQKMTLVNIGGYPVI